MNKKLLITILLIGILKISTAQKKENYYFNSFYFGSSLTFREFQFPKDVYEFTWNVSFATSVGKRFYTGIQVLNIFINYSKNDTKYYNIYGLFTQYNIVLHGKIRPFVELSLNRGNYYLPSGSLYPEIGMHYYYMGIGGGTDIPLNFISKHLFLDLSFILYLQRDKRREQSFFFDYNQYIIGLNYRFGKIQKK